MRRPEAARVLRPVDVVLRAPDLVAAWVVAGGRRAGVEEHLVDLGVRAEVDDEPLTRRLHDTARPARGDVSVERVARRIARSRRRCGRRLAAVVQDRVRESVELRNRPPVRRRAGLVDSHVARDLRGEGDDCARRRRHTAGDVLPVHRVARHEHLVGRRGVGRERGWIHVDAVQQRRCRQVDLQPLAAGLRSAGRPNGRVVAVEHVPGRRTVHRRRRSPAGAIEGELAQR